MAIASTPTKLSLSQFAKIMGLHPLHFEGVYVADQSHCGSAWFQYDWQNFQRVSRETIARAIMDAENQIEDFLGYNLLPDWTIDERVQTSRPFYKDLVNYGNGNMRGYGQTIRPVKNWFISGGMREATVIKLSSIITWTDQDSDGYFETGTVSAITTVEDDCEVRVFYPAKSGDNLWEIRPARISISGGTVTATFRRELCVLESILEMVQDPAQNAFADGLNNADFLTTVDIYQVTNNPATSANLLWEPTGNCGCSVNNSCAECAYQTQTACLIARDPRLSIVTYSPAVWDTVTKQFDFQSLSIGRQPDQLRTWYYSGYKWQQSNCPNKEMDPFWAQTISYFAASMLERNPCDCNGEFFEQFREDMAFVNGADQLNRYEIRRAELTNPFGSRRGALMAWIRVKNRQIGKVGAGGAVIV